MGGAKYLRQLKTGRIYLFDVNLAKRKDMVEYDPDKAERMIKAKENRIKELKDRSANLSQSIPQEVIADAKKLADLDKEIEDLENKEIAELTGEDLKDPKTEEELEQERRQDIIDKDPEIQKIDAMKTKDDARSYITAEYGEVPDESLKLVELKEMATTLRINRLFE